MVHHCLVCLRPASALCTSIHPPPPAWRRLKKAEFAVCGGGAKKSFPSPKTQTGEERGSRINLASTLVPLSDEV